MDNDGPCEFCGRMTSSISARPSDWPLVFTWPDGTGRVKHHHTGCVQDRLFRRKPEHDTEIEAFRLKQLRESVR